MAPATACSSSFQTLPTPIAACHVSMLKRRADHLRLSVYVPHGPLSLSRFQLRPQSSSAVSEYVVVAAAGLVALSIPAAWQIATCCWSAMAYVVTGNRRASARSRRLRVRLSSSSHTVIRTPRHNTTTSRAMPFVSCNVRSLLSTELDTLLVDIQQRSVDVLLLC